LTIFYSKTTTRQLGEQSPKMGGFVLGQKYLLYHYNPSKVAAAIFTVLFVITTSIHIFQLVRKRTWYFIPFIIGGTCKSIPYLQCLFPIQKFAKLYLFWIKQLGYHSISTIYFWPKIPG